jgi:GMP synthase (glutamine-hydrolysing)
LVNKILIIDCGSSKVPNICSIVKNFGAEILLVHRNNLKPEDATECTGIIISGAPNLITQSDKEELLKPFLFLKEIDIPVLGICFGHQALGMLYGAEIFLGKEIRTEISIAILNSSPIFNGIKTEKVFVSQDHTEGINLPEDFILLANSAHYPNEAMQHISKKIYGVQFHPEVSSDNIKQIITNFLCICLHNNS